jgi:hypothetical protein
MLGLGTAWYSGEAIGLFMPRSQSTGLHTMMAADVHAVVHTCLQCNAPLHPC